MVESKENHTTSDSGQFEWVPVGDSAQERSGRFEGTGELSRRGFLSAITGVVVVSMALGGTAFLTAPASASTSFSANDVAVTSHNGQLRELTIAPSGSVSFEGLESEANGISVVVDARLPDGTWSQVATKDISASGVTGTVSYDVAETSLLNSGPFTKNDFRPADGTTADTTVEVRVSAVVHESSGEDVTATGSDTFTVSVTNVARGAGVGGEANTDAN